MQEQKSRSLWKVLGSGAYLVEGVCMHVCAGERGKRQREGWNKVLEGYHQCSLLHKKKEFATSYDWLIFGNCKGVRYKVMSCVNCRIILSFKKCFLSTCAP